MRVVVNATPRSLYPWKDPVPIGGSVGPMAGLDGCGQSLLNRDSISGPSNALANIAHVLLRSHTPRKVPCRRYIYTIST